MPNISIFLNQCLPLSEIFVYHQASALKRYSPQFLACNKPKNSIKHDISETIINQNNNIAEKISEKLFKATGYNKLLENKIRDSDLVHAHFGPTGWLASQLTVKTHKPLIVTLHGFDITKNNITRKNDGRLQALYSKKRSVLAQRTDKFLCVSNFMVGKAIEFGFPEEKCQLHYMGIPLFEHKQPKAMPIKGEPIRILCVGRLIPVKAHSKLIEAISYLERDGMDVHLDIIGDGELRHSLEEQAANSLKDYKFHGAVPHNEVLKLMRSSHLYCHTSMTQDNGQTESFGLVVSEAQWAGLPVVAFSSGGVPEAMKHGKTGLLCKEGDVIDLYQNIKNIITDSNLMQSMSEAAPKFIKENFCNIIQTAKLEEVYDSAIVA